jgi:hypothetical protein
MRAAAGRLEGVGYISEGVPVMLMLFFGEITVRALLSCTGKRV